MAETYLISIVTLSAIGAFLLYKIDKIRKEDERHLENAIEHIKKHKLESRGFTINGKPVREVIRKDSAG